MLLLAENAAPAHVSGHWGLPIVSGAGKGTGLAFFRPEPLHRANLDITSGIGSWIIRFPAAHELFLATEKEEAKAGPPISVRPTHLGRITASMTWITPLVHAMPVFTTLALSTFTAPPLTSPLVYGNGWLRRRRGITVTPGALRPMIVPIPALHMPTIYKPGSARCWPGSYCRRRTWR